MARCCGTGSCSCKVVGSGGVSVTGTGTTNDPFVVSANLNLAVTDTPTVDLTLSGTGTTANPWTLRAAATVKLDDLTDVTSTTPSSGQVLGFNGTQWVPVAPTTAATGAVQHDTSLLGDGSGANALQINEDPARLLATTSSGLGLSDTGMNWVVRHFIDTTARNAASPAPTLNALSMLDSNPGQLDYWNGTAWVPARGQISMATGSTELMALSGSFSGQPVQILTKQIVAQATDGAGSVPILTAADLAGRAGVLSVSVTPVGAIGWGVSLAPGGSSLLGYIYLLTNGVLYANAQISATVIAYVY